MDFLKRAFCFVYKNEIEIPKKKWTKHFVTELLEKMMILFGFAGIGLVIFFLSYPEQVLPSMIGMVYLLISTALAVDFFTFIVTMLVVRRKYNQERDNNNPLE